MNRPIAPSGEEPIEATVRQLLWRLRARLVTPPDEERSVADLDRLLAAAREHAQVVPEPQPNPAEEQPAADASIRYLSFETVGRVAAAMVLLVAIGGGLASVRDGAITVDALLGRTPTAPLLAEPTEAGGVASAELSTREPEVEVEDPSTSSEGPPEGREDLLSGDPRRSTPADADADGGFSVTERVEDESRTDSSETAPETLERPTPEVPRTPPVPVKPAPRDSERAPRDAKPTPSEPAPSEPAPRDSEPAPRDSEPAPKQGEVIAAPPPPSTTDGFGGRPDCADASEDEAPPEACLPAPDAPATDDAVPDESATEGLDRLARNRAGNTVREP